MAGTPQPMTDLGRHLSGPMSEQNLTALCRLLDDEVGNIKRKLNRGVDQESYKLLNMRMLACMNSQLVLKSIQTYQN